MVVGLSIIMNSMKKLEIRNYDILDLITNEVSHFYSNY